MRRWIETLASPSGLPWPHLWPPPPAFSAKLWALEGSFGPVPPDRRSVTRGTGTDATRSREIARRGDLRWLGKVSGKDGRDPQSRELARRGGPYPYGTWGSTSSTARRAMARAAWASSRE